MKKTYKNFESQIIDKPKYETKLKQLEKLETKIEHNLETHKKNLDFFEQNDNCPTCTQKIEEKFRDEKITKKEKSYRFERWYERLVKRNYKYRK